MKSTIGLGLISSPCPKGQPLIQAKGGATAVLILELYLIDFLVNAVFTLFIAPATPAAASAATPAPFIC